MKNKKIVLGQPYAGALYAFFNDELVSADAEWRLSTKTKHPYYQHLFGEDPTGVLDVALMLLTIFDEVYTFPADAYMPRIEVGFRADWELFCNFRRDNERQLTEVCERLTQNTNVESWQKKLFVEQTSYTSFLANKLKCPVFCGENTSAILQDTPFESHLNNIARAENFALEYKRGIAAPIFNTPSLQLLQDVKNDAELRTYAKKFAKAMMVHSAKQSINDQLDSALKNNNFKQRKEIKYIAELVDILSHLPLIGTFAGLPLYAASKVLNAAATAKPQWHELSPIINKIEVRNNLQAYLLRANEHQPS